MVAAACLCHSVRTGIGSGLRRQAGKKPTRFRITSEYDAGTLMRCECVRVSVSLCGGEYHNSTRLHSSTVMSLFADIF